MKLTIRKSSGIYYQLGYYEKSKWIHVEHLGSADNVLKLVRAGKEALEKTYQTIPRIKK